MGAFMFNAGILFVWFIIGKFGGGRFIIMPIGGIGGIGGIGIPEYEYGGWFIMGGMPCGGIIGGLGGGKDMLMFRNELKFCDQNKYRSNKFF